MAYISPMLTNIVTAVKKASINLNRDFSEIERLQNSVKGSMDFTKIAFDKIQKGLKNELGKILPALPVVMVSEKVPQSGMFLILSGIEGLANFAHGNPEFAISAALMDGQTVLAGVVYNPARDELFFAEKGKGAFKEGFRSHERLRVAARQELDGALVAVRPMANDAELSAKIVNNTLRLCHDVRISGATALDLAYVAAREAGRRYCSGNNAGEYGGRNPAGQRSRRTGSGYGAGRYAHRRFADGFEFGESDGGKL